MTGSDKSADSGIATPIDPSASEGWGVYVHVPYCQTRCRYCDFHSNAGAPSSWAAFAADLKAELAARIAPFDESELRTIYVGGGTPSRMPANLLADLLSTIVARSSRVRLAEVTIEANPGTVDRDGWCGLRAAGFDRASIGWQSSSDRLLAFLGRTHDHAANLACAQAARAAGFDNIGVDLIFGIPGQTLQDLDRDLDELARFSPEHISAYGLTYHPGTELGRRRATGEVTPLEEELEAAMMIRLHERLQALGYEHYEVSNFSRPGRGGLHNSRYWTGGRYLGLGPGAHSFCRDGWQTGWRWETRRSPDGYRAAWAAPQGHGIPRPSDPSIEWVERLDPKQMMTERFLCGLRFLEGVDLDEPAVVDWRSQLLVQAREAERRGWVTLAGTRIRPTFSGWMFADSLALLFF